MYTNLRKMTSSNIIVTGDIGSPFFHVSLAESTGSRAEDEKILQEAVDLAAREGILLTRAKYVVSQEIRAPSPSIRVCVSAGFTKREVERAANVIRDSLRRAMKNRY
jgi:serine palmitoyltransferase